MTRFQWDSNYFPNARYIGFFVMTKRVFCLGFERVFYDLKERIIISEEDLKLAQHRIIHQLYTLCITLCTQWDNILTDDGFDLSTKIAALVKFNSMNCTLFFSK